MFKILGHIFRTPQAQARLLRARVLWVGFMRDFWKDGRPGWFSGRGTGGTKARRKGAAGAGADPEVETPVSWSADRVQILEKMWGEGHHLPGGESYVNDLVAPLGLTREMSVLDLAAGLGGLARRIATEFGSYVTGLEADPALASRGMVMSIAAGKAKQASVEAYVPEAFETSKHYDAIFARELFCRVQDKERLFKVVHEATKTGGGQVVFTDFLCEPSRKDHPAFQAAFAREGGISPLSFIEMVKAWKGLGYDLRVAEEQTDFYRHEILRGMGNLVEQLETVQPDADTKKGLLFEIDYWGKRLVAFKMGLKYYRFYGIRY